MAEVFVEFETPVKGPGGRVYTARACGAPMDDGERWQGWIEFVPADSEQVLRTSRETVQPKRSDLQYWATGLTPTFLEGALERALEGPPAVPVATGPVRPTYEEPAPPVVHVANRTSPPIPAHAVLDPFEVYLQGDDILQRELSALQPFHLRNIIRAYGLASPDELDLDHMSRTSLADLIVAAVRKRMGG